MNEIHACEYCYEEMLRSVTKFPTFASPHEGYAVILEELDELWEAIKLNQKTPDRMKRIREEAIQVGAMAMRLLVDCVPDPIPETKRRVC